MGAHRPAWRRWAVAALLVLSLAVGLRLLVLAPREPRQEDATPISTPTPPQATPAPVSTPSQATPAPVQDKTPEIVTVKPVPESHVDVTLHDGEQTTILSDQASLAVAFNEFGQERYVTVTVNGKPNAVLGANARFAFTAGGKQYSVYVLGINTADRSVRLRVVRSQ